MTNTWIIDYGEEMAGQADDIANYVKQQMKDDIDMDDWDAMQMFQIQADLLQELKAYDDELVQCTWNPMGAWEIHRLVREAK